MTNDFTRRRIKNFENNFGTGELHLAYHAALPVVLNAELLHLLRVNFFLNSSHSLSYTSEAKLLLSPLCKEVGDGLYEIYPDIRQLLLEGLATEYGEQRIREVATLLWQYTVHASPWQDRDRLQRTQQLTALNFLNPQKAIEWMNDTEMKLDETEEDYKKWLIAMRKDLEKNILSIRPAKQKNIKNNKKFLRLFFEESSMVLKIKKHLLILSDSYFSLIWIYSYFIELRRSFFYNFLSKIFLSHLVGWNEDDYKTDSSSDIESDMLSD